MRVVGVDREGRHGPRQGPLLDTGVLRMCPGVIPHKADSVTPASLCATLHPARAPPAGSTSTVQRSASAREERKRMPGATRCPKWCARNKRCRGHGWSRGMPLCVALFLGAFCARAAARNQYASQWCLPQLWPDCLAGNVTELSTTPPCASTKACDCPLATRRVRLVATPAVKRHQNRACSPKPRSGASSAHNA